MLKTFLVLFMLTQSMSSAHAMPFPRFLKSCQDVIQNIFGAKKAEFKGSAYLPPEDADPTHLELIKNLKDEPRFQESYPHLPFMEQSLKKFKDTNEPFVEYYMRSGDWNKKGYNDYLENTVEVILFPHSSIHGHVRLRIGKKMYGYENISAVFNESFNASRIFKEQRKLKRGSKAGNIGVVYTLSGEQKELLTKHFDEIERFYNSSQRYNMPPFDGKGEKQIKIITDESGALKFHSATPPSGYGNRKKFTAQLVSDGDTQYLEAPNGLRQLVTKNENDELITEGYSCASSAGHVLRNFLGIQVKDMPFAGSFLTHLKNGAEGFTKPDAVIHYYPSSDL